jgi:hypothetical protein
MTKYSVDPTILAIGLLATMLLTVRVTIRALRWHCTGSLREAFTRRPEFYLTGLPHPLNAAATLSSAAGPSAIGAADGLATPDSCDALPTAFIQ